jgi:hypothetical protein
VASSAVERHEAAIHAVSPLARRAALIVAVLAAFLAVSQVFAENKVKNILKSETRIVAHQVTGHPDSQANIARIEANASDDEDAHHKLEFAIVFLEIGIVLATVSGLLGVVYLMGLSVALGGIGAVLAVLGLFA